jgi:hypothetical protein|tara:strand:+ start:3393 stop:3581 length:189 start_codon:yes stop_codon:yes gene_type:complete
MKFTNKQIHIIKQALEVYEEELLMEVNNPYSDSTELEKEKTYKNINSIVDILNHAELHNDNQ